MGGISRSLEFGRQQRHAEIGARRRLHIVAVVVLIDMDRQAAWLVEIGRNVVSLFGRRVVRLWFLPVIKLDRAGLQYLKG